MCGVRQRQRERERVVARIGELRMGKREICSEVGREREIEEIEIPGEKCTL